eukprot:GHRR01020258.1.p2 GENE.GHRR01020258.1~~GHRR01020258.1.p2  ORF type:complete len:116 (-),score=22.25 GHRR01020258.1:600-947(-)
MGHAAYAIRTVCCAEHSFCVVLFLAILPGHNHGCNWLRSRLILLSLLPGRTMLWVADGTLKWVHCRAFCTSGLADAATPFIIISMSEFEPDGSSNSITYEQYSSPKASVDPDAKT